jgi:hypothetical protein
MFKYLETNYSRIYEQIKTGLNPENVLYHAVLNLLSSRLRCEILKIKTRKVYKKLILSVLVCVCVELGHIKQRTQIGGVWETVSALCVCESCIILSLISDYFLNRH